MILLGIDPGLATTGFGVIKKEKGELHAVDYGVILTSAKSDLLPRLKHLNQNLKKIIKKYRPSAVSVEKIYFSKNTKTALDIGQCRGVILLTIADFNLPLYEFTPLEVKQAITSYGAADKKQVQKMVQTILKLKKLPWPDDAADGLALAITLANSSLRTII